MSDNSTMMIVIIIALIIFLCLSSGGGYYYYYYYYDTEDSNVWTDRGHWIDNTGHTLPNQLLGGAITTVDACKAEAIDKGYNVIGLQNGGYCWAGKDLDYSFLGASASTVELGGASNNHVFTTQSYLQSTKNPAAVTTPPAGVSTPPAGGSTPPAGGSTPPAGGSTPPAGVSTSTIWTDKGHWVDNAGRTLPNKLLGGAITTVDGCKAEAIRKQYNVIGLQNRGECWAGTNLDYSFLGERPSSTAELGLAYENHVFATNSYVKGNKNPLSVFAALPDGGYNTNANKTCGPNAIRGSMFTSLEAAKNSCTPDSTCLAISNPGTNQFYKVSGSISPVVNNGITCYVKTTTPIIPPSSTSTTSWTDRGKWIDTNHWLIDVPITTNPASLAECKNQALARGYNIIGVNDNGQCWAGTDLTYNKSGQPTAASVNAIHVYTTQGYSTTPHDSDSYRVNH